MTRSLRSVIRWERERLADVEAWIAWVRLAAVPFVAFEIAVERGNYPRGHEPWAWAVGAVFALGAACLFWLWRRGVAGGGLGLAALAFDGAVVSAWVVVYSFEPASPVRQLLFLPVIEAALRYGRLGGALAPLASALPLAVFESRAADRLGAPYDPGHVVFPIALQLLVGLVVGALASRRRAGA